MGMEIYPGPYYSRIPFINPNSADTNEWILTDVLYYRSQREYQLVIWEKIH